MENRIVNVKEKPQFEEKDAARVYLDLEARVVRDDVKGEFRCCF